MESRGNFNTGDLEISLNGVSLLDLCLVELDQTSGRFQSGLKEELEKAILKANKMGYCKAIDILKQSI